MPSKVLQIQQPQMKTEKSSLVDRKVISIQDNKADPVEFTDIVGGNGKWQIKLLIITMISGIPTAWNHLGMAFLAYPQDHWCSRPLDSNVSLPTWWSEFLPNETIKGKSQHSQCKMFVTNHSDGSLIVTKTVSCGSWEYSTEFNSIAEHWDLVCEKEWLLSTSQSVYMIGFLLAVLMSGQMADVYGRHPTVMLNVIILLIAGVAAAYSNSFIMFTIFRFFVGIGYAGLGLVIFVLFVETLGSRYRAKYAFLHGFGWHIGYMLLPLIAWLLPDWFYLQLAITLPSAIFIAYYWFVPESPRWLLSNGNLEKALPILEVAAKTNGKEVKDLEVEAKKVCCLESKEKEWKSKATCLDLLRTPNLRKKTLSLYFIWIVIAFTYYGLSLNTSDLQGNVYLNFFLAGLMEVPATLFCMITLDRFGRKKPFIFTLFSGGVSCFACLFVPEGLPGLKTALAMFGKMMVSASFSIVYVYSAEIFPTVARNVGVGSSSTMARIGSAVAPFMRDLGKATDPCVPLALFGILSIISAALVIKLPETNNHPVPETLDQAENFGKEIKEVAFASEDRYTTNYTGH